MNVSVGSFSDPDGLEGLAHFFFSINVDQFSASLLFGGCVFILVLGSCEGCSYKAGS
jgi:hypothetical protein